MNLSKYSSYILYLLITILVVILYINDFGPLNSLQQALDDTFCHFTASEDTSPNMVLVKIDGFTQNEFGTWPWNYDLVADLLAATASGKPKAIALTFEIPEDAKQDSAGFTNILSEQLNWIDNVILPYDIALAAFRSKKTNNHNHLFNYSITVENRLGLMDERSSLQVRKVFLPAEKILENDLALGFVYTTPDNDRVLRHQPLIMNYEGFYYPSLSLMAAAMYHGVSTNDILVVENEKIQLGNKLEIPINDRGELFIDYPKGEVYTSYSAADLLGESFNYNLLKDKMVLICTDDFGITEYFKTTAGTETPDYYIEATLIENIINGNFIIPKNNQQVLNLLILFILGGLFAYILPQVSLLYRFIILFCGLFILFNVNYFLISSLRIIPQTIYIALELFLFMVASPLLETTLIMGEKQSKTTGKKKGLPKVDIEKSKSAESREVPVRELKKTEGDPENIKTEPFVQQAEQFQDYQTITFDEDIKETTATPEIIEQPSEKESDRSEKALSSSQPEIISPQPSLEENSDGLIVPDVTSADDNNAKTDSGPLPESITKLGRYQILGTVGKGAMGHVYKGVDPAINRPVALKTIRLDFVNDPEEMEELKERLFREAQAAGKLSHPNIVTIYDVGSEGHLQYIAMEYLEGHTIEELIKRKVKFNYKIISQIIMQICSALEYAHARGIVHRDIKPANIMVLTDYTIKVMDYGIARIDSNSMTKTGIAMGTPNYISPEQLQGKTVDHRADLFSLGVVIYEMLLGKRPFKGENITSLIYSILNKEPEKPSNVNPQIPLLFDHIITMALKKNPGERYQKASDIKVDLANFVEAFSVKK